MNDVLVTGGIGHLGRDTVQLMKARGDQVRVLARTPGQDPDVEWIQGDLSTGAGIREAVAGRHTIVHAATHSPAAQRGYLRMGDFLRSPPDVDIHGTRRLLDEAARAGAEHVLYVSIVGVQQSRFPYSRLKGAAENLVREGAVPWSIMPATGFYWLLARMLDTMAKRRIWPLPSNLAMQPGDSAEFAEYVVECVADGPRGDRMDFGGPEPARRPGEGGPARGSLSPVWDVAARVVVFGVKFDDLGALGQDRALARAGRRHQHHRRCLAGVLLHSPQAVRSFIHGVSAGRRLGGSGSRNPCSKRSKAVGPRRAGVS
jgi:uncharacterized protein YbjT (DUF2867 family)